MEINIIIKKLANKNNGQFFRITWMTEIPTTAHAERMGVTALKLTDATVRKGINYSHQKRVIAKVEEGKVLTHKLPWGTWDEQHPGLVINHKGNSYIRLYMGPNKSKNQYFLNGVPCSYEELKNSGYIQNSWFKKVEGGEKPDALTIKAQNIQGIF